MDDSPRRHNAADKHHTSARRLFMHREERSNGKKQSSEGQARRRLVLIADDEAVNSGMDDPKREANVVARLMGLDSPQHTSAQCISSSKPVKNQQQQVHTNQGEVKQLQELLKIKEPLLLRELLRESDDVPYRAASAPKKASLMDKFAGFVKRRPAPSVEQVKNKSELALSPVKSKPKSPVGISNKASPIRSPSKSKRGLMLEAAVKVLDSEPQQVCSSTKIKQQKQQEQNKQQQKKQGRKRFSLSRSSSEPCLSSSTGSSAALKSDSKGGLIAKLSGNVGRELRHVFGGHSSKTALSSSLSSSSSQAQPSMVKRKISNLVRSKSDLGLQKIEHKIGGLNSISKQQQDKERCQDSFSASAEFWPSGSVPSQDDFGERQSFSHRPVKVTTTTKESSMKSSSVNNNNGNGGAGILRLFGNRDRGKENRDSNATRKSEPSSSLVKALLLRKKNGSSTSSNSSSSSTASNSVPGASTSRPTTTATKILQDQRPKNTNRRSPESVGIVSSVSERLQCCDEFSDDTTEPSRSPTNSSSSSTSTRLDGSSCDCRPRSESGQPSPVSVLETPFVDEIHTPLDSSSGEDSPEAKLRLRLRDEAVMPSSLLSATASNDNIINAILDISRIRCIDLSSIGIVTTSARSSSREEQAAYIQDILTTSQFLSDRKNRSSTSGIWFEIDSDVFTILEKKFVTQRPKCSSLQSRKLLFDCVQEAVDLRFGRTNSPGSFMSAKRLSRLSDREIASRIHEQIGEWEAMFCWSTDDLVEKDMSVGSGRWQDWNAEVEEIAMELERGLLKGLVDELLGLTGFDY